MDKTNKKAYIEELINSKNNNVRSNTQKGNYALLQHLKAFNGTKKLKIKNIDAKFCKNFAIYLTNRMKSSSAKTYMQKLHALLEDAVFCGYISYNPMPAIDRMLPRYVPNSKDHLTVSEVKKLELTHCRHQSTKLAFLFSCYTGLRLSDIETLRWTDICKQSNGYLLKKVQVKTNCEVQVPLGRQAINILKKTEIKDEQCSDYVFKLPSRSTISTDLKTWANSAGINKNITFHVSRVTFVTLSIAADVNIYVVSKLCGHTNVKTTQVYARIIDTTQQDAIMRLDEIFENSKSPKTTKRE